MHLLHVGIANITLTTGVNGAITTETATTTTATIGGMIGVTTAETVETAIVMNDVSVTTTTLMIGVIEISGAVQTTGATGIMVDKISTILSQIISTESTTDIRGVIRVMNHHDIVWVTTTTGRQAL